MRLLAVLAAIATLALAQPAASKTLTVYSAASLTDVLQRIGEAYTRETGTALTFSFASSSKLARQIEAGAPADVIASASVEWADYLDQRGLIAPGTRSAPIGNRLAVVAPADSAAALAEPLTAGQVEAALGPDGRIAIGDPAHVPAGIYAKESLTSLGLWDALAPRFAFADDVRAALALVSRGEAPLGIVYTTDAKAAAGVRVLLVLPAGSHEQIAYAFGAVTGGDVEEAKRFLAFLSGAEAREVFEGYGFEVR